MAAQYVMYAVVIAVVIGAAVFASRRAQRLAVDQKTPFELGQALLQRFDETTQPGETRPISVIAFHRGRALIVGVTNQRVLAVKEDGVLHATPYDEAGEHLPSAQKTRERRGYFRWTHKDGEGYWPRVVAGPFAREDWHIPVTVPGHAEQRANLAQFASIFHFAWFYGEEPS